jgi:Cu2+-exporting ATPase
LNAPALAPAPCFHCGLPVPAGGRWDAWIDGASRAMCCPGCAAAAQAIVDAGFGDYYGNRTEYAAPAGELDIDAPGLALFDEAGNSGEACFSVEGMRCAACVWLVERRLAQLPGVLESNLNVATGRLWLRWDPAACKPSDVLRALRAIGYPAWPYDAQRHGEALERARKTLFRRLFVAGLSMMQVMMYAVPAYLATDGTMDAGMQALMRWASLLLTLPAVAYSAQPFLRGAWLDARRGMPGMDVPVALGIAAAFGASVLALVRGTGEVYFDSITMFIFLLLGSRYLELGARQRAARGLERVQRELPASALRMPGYPGSRTTELVPAARLAPGDVILVQPGQAVAADGVIVEGETEADLALLTGESRPQRKRPGDVLPSGAVNAGQAVALRVSCAAHDSTLAMLARLVERAGQGKPRIALWADKVGAWFVATLLVLAVAVFAAWQWADPARAWAAAIAVLVVSCPCALSLATPTALAAATDRLLRRGVLAVQPHVLEALERATHIVFDKTGTLTLGRPVVRTVRPYQTLGSGECLRVAAALEAASAHPLGVAIRTACRIPAGTAHDLTNVVGQGVEGVVDGVRYRLGNKDFVAGIAPRCPPAGAAAGATRVWLGAAHGWLAHFDLADSVRPDAASVVRHFQRRGKVVLLLSGDQAEPALAVAAQLGLDGCEAGCLPQQKLDYVRALQQRGAVVAMVGDGINDAAVLCGADVSFAMGGGAALAQLHADCVLMKDGLAPLQEAAQVAHKAARVIRQNLAWATVYNLAAIPAAAFGLLNPWLSGIGMAASSALVVVNALRLRKGG